MSGLLLIVGVLMVVAGLVLAVVPMAVKLTMAFGVTGIAVSAAGLAVLFVGLVFCLLAQLARAVFDGADAVRAMAEWQAALVATSHRNDKR